MTFCTADSSLAFPIGRLSQSGRETISGRGREGDVGKEDEVDGEVDELNIDPQEKSAYIL